MAQGKPEIDEGFVQLAHELDAALDVGDFTKGERLIFREVKVQCFSARKGLVATIDPLKVAERWGKFRQFTQKGLKMLVRAGVLVHQGGDLYRYNKYYRTWKFGDGLEHPDKNGSRFSNVELSQIASAPEIAKAYANVLPPKPAEKKAINGLPPAIGGLPNSAINGLPNCNPPIAEKQSVDCRAIKKSAGASEREEEKEEQDTKTADGGPVPQAIDSTQPIPDAFARVVSIAEASPALAEVGLAESLRDAWHRDGKLRGWWDYPTTHDQWRLAMIELAGEPAAKRSVRYLLGIVGRIVRETPAKLSDNPSERNTTPIPPVFVYTGPPRVYHKRRAAGSAVTP